MEVFVVLNGKREGPLTLYQLGELLREGKVTGATIGWMRGQENWVPLREIPPAQGVIQDLERERLDAELAKQVRPAVPPEVDIPYQRLPSHGLARYGARMIDMLLAQLVLMVLVGLPEAPEGFRFPVTFEEMKEDIDKAIAREFSEEEMVYRNQVAGVYFGAMAGFWVLEAFLLAWFGTTPGKYLFRLRVEDHRGGRPGFVRALGRSLLVFLLGMGCTLPLLVWLANFLAFLRLQNRGSTVWDERMCTVVRQERMSRQRALVILVVFLVIAGAAFLIPAGGGR